MIYKTSTCPLDLIPKDTTEPWINDSKELLYIPQNSRNETEQIDWV